MSFKLALWLCVLCVVVILTAVGEESDDHKLVVEFIRKELKKSPTISQTKALVNFLHIIHEEDKTGHSTRVEDLASLLREGLEEAVYMYVNSPPRFENEERKTDQWNDFDKAVITIPNEQQYNSNSQEPSFLEKMTAFFRKIFQNIVQLKENLYQVSATLVKEVVLTGKRLLDTSFGPEFLENMKKWWNGEISGRRCANNIFQSAGQTMGAASGATAGIYIGGILFGPLGAAVGAFGGAVLGSKAFELFMQQLMEEIFDLPKSEAEENAYNFFGLNKYASDSEINAAFRRKARIYHPDNRNSGDHEKFILTNIHMQILKMARGTEKGD